MKHKKLDLVEFINNNKNMSVSKYKENIEYIALQYFTNAIMFSEAIEILGLEEKEEEVLNLFGYYQKKWDKYLEDGKEEYDGDDGDIILSELADDIINI